eukprot:COSAG04_NODE_16615_length_493_cov_8.873096_1_plen_56_part_10
MRTVMICRKPKSGNERSKKRSVRAMRACLDAMAACAYGGESSRVASVSLILSTDLR